MPKKRIAVTEHAAERYLQRVLGLPLTEENIRAARLFLSLTLSNRVCSVVGKDITASWTRLSIQHKGAIFVYDPKDKTVYSAQPARNAKEKLEMYLLIPADFSVDPEIPPNSKLYGRLFEHRWPIICARANSLRLRVCADEVDVDLKRRVVTLADSETPDKGNVRGTNPSDTN